MALAERLERLGTETAFAVSLAAAEWGAKGNRIFPFHLGDLNIATPQNVVDAMNKAIKDGKTGYCPAAGIPQLREALAEDVGSRRGLNFAPANVVVQPGGKPVITKFIQTVMNPGEEVLYPNPGYPIYESQIEYFGGVAKSYRYIPSSTGFNIDLDHLKSQITSKTKAIIYNDLQNPIGAESTDAEREAIAEIAIKHNLWVLSDEAYFEMRYSGTSKSIASLPGMLERTVILYTFSKKFAMTGWRLGFAANKKLAPFFTNWITNTESCASHITQWAGVEALNGPQTDAQRMHDIFHKRRDLIVGLLNKVPGITCKSPGGAFYAWPNVTEACKMTGCVDSEEFRKRLLYEAGVAVLADIHFGPRVPNDGQHIRFSYAASDAAITAGIARVAEFIQKNS